MSSLLFLNPWLLVALTALPGLWFLLRIMPPAPKRIFLPSTRFLNGLVPKTRTPSKTPWWILLLRLTIAALVILALAQPVLNPSRALNSENPIHLIVDNGWSSANLWDTKIRAAEDVLVQAQRQGINVYLSTTAPEPSDGKPISLGPLSGDEALSRLKGLVPYPWPADLKIQNDRINDQPKAIDSYYFSDGVHQKNADDFIETLQRKGQTVIILPKAEHLPVTLTRTDDQNGNPAFVLNTTESIPQGFPVTLQAQGQNGNILGVETLTIEGQTTEATISLPATLRADLARVKLVEQQHAGAVYLLDGQFRKKRVGIASPLNEGEAKPFIEASFYLTRALEPYAELEVSTLDVLLDTDPSMIILPDIAALSPEQLERLDVWVRDGGLLLRFAGPAMEQARQHFLLPTPIRKGARSLDGSLTWENPPKLESFSDHGPLAGIVPREDIVIKQQLLAEPASDLSSKTWAHLDDGTPLITADQLDEGLVVMIHTTASPDWSNLPLSGVFVQILSRLVNISGSSPDTLTNITKSLEAIRVLDGYGRFTSPDASAQPIVAQNFDQTHVSHKYPPGIYGHGGIQRVLNLGDHIPKLTSLDATGLGDFATNVKTVHYGTSYETNLMPFLLVMGFVLLLIDWIAMLIMSSSLRFSFLKRAAAMIVLFIFIGIPAHAQVPDNLKYADGLYLGFIKTSNAGLNAQTRRGLEALKEALTMRTSAEPEGVVSLNPETDILSFFPLIYWAVDASEEELSAEALRNIQDYLDHGGTILFDTREQVASSDPTRGGPNAAALARMTAGLNIPALAPIQDNHVLGKSFYLLSNFPGRYTGGTIWVESNSENGRDGVSSVLIGSHDWASAWAQSAGRNYRSGASSRQRELAIRFGVNVMMYALTGNYKADQVHVKHILERLGQ